MDKIDDNNSRTNPSEKFDDYTQNPWTRLAARERNKRKKRNASDGKASEILSKSIDALPKAQNYAPKVKQQRQRIGVLRERSISARHRIGKRWIKVFLMPVSESLIPSETTSVGRRRQKGF